MVDEFKDPLDKEYECPNCGGDGGFFEEGIEDPDYWLDCARCGGTGSLEPSHHPGADNKGAQGMTEFDIREETHRRDYDVENAMPTDSRPVAVLDRNEERVKRIIDPKRLGFRRDSPMKQTRVPLVSDEQMAAVDPNIRHRLPAVYLRERDGQPTNAGMNITGASHPLFIRSNPMMLAWRLLKSPEGPWFHGTSRMNQATQEGLQPKGRVRYPDNTQAPSPALFFTTDPKEARGFAMQSKSRPDERPGVVRVQNLEGIPVKVKGGHRHIVVRKPVLRDRFEEVKEDG